MESQIQSINHRKNVKEGLAEGAGQLIIAEEGVALFNDGSIIHEYHQVKQNLGLDLADFELLHPPPGLIFDGVLIHQPILEVLVLFI